jgi:hypothetical protein
MLIGGRVVMGWAGGRAELGLRGEELGGSLWRASGCVTFRKEMRQGLLVCCCLRVQVGLVVWLLALV